MLANLRWWADLLDARFRIPGTNVRFGIDPILSFVPGFGELATPLFTVVLFAYALKLGVPPAIVARMALNALLDAAIGAVPIVGNVGDLFWRANTTNLALLEQFAQPGAKPRPADYAVVWALTMFMGLLLVLPVLIGVWFALAVWTWLAS
jgi:hypothetical protein